MKQVIDFFSKLLDSADWPARWHCGKWSEFHGWLYIVSDLLIWSAYFAIPFVILRFIKKKHGARFIKLYFLFAGFILACGATHFLDALAFWLPVYRLNALVNLITGVISWITVFNIIRYLPALMSLRTQDQLEAEIEQRKKAEEQVRLINASLDRKVAERTAELNDYKFALDASCIVDITNSEGIMTYVNENFCKISGYPRDELVGKHSNLISDEQDGPESANKIKATITNGRTWKGESRNKAKDGSTYWWDTTIVPFLDADGKPYQYMSIRFDITNRKESEEKQRELEDRIKVKTSELTGIFERITDGFIILNKDLQYTYANRKIGEMIKRDPADLIGKSLLEEFPETVGSKTYNLFVTAMHSGEYEHSLDYYASLDLWLENHIYPIPDGISVFVRNVTEQKRAESLLQESEARFRRIFESNMVGFIFWNSEGEIMEANDRFLEIVGYPRKDLEQGKIRWNDMTPPEYKYLDAIALEDIRVTGICSPYEKQYMRKDGSRVEVLLAAASLSEDSNRMGSCCVIDISESKKAEQQILKLNDDLFKSEQIFRSLVENNNDILRLSDENLKVVYQSPNLQRITGWSAEELEKYRDVDLVHPDDVRSTTAFIQEIYKQPGTLLPFMYRYRHKEGHYIWVEGTAINLLQDSMVQGIVTNFHDVTERKLAEARLVTSEKTYKSIASNIPGSVICILDRDFRYLLIEGDLMEKLGYSKSTVLGRKAIDVLPPELYDQAAARLKRVFNDESFSVDATRPGLHTNARYVPMKDENHHVYAAMVVVIDVTELKEAELRIAELNVGLEQKVEERTAELNSVNKELEAFSYSVSHDLRAPLRAVNGYSNILIEDYGNVLDNEGNRVLQAIVKNSVNMGQLIDDLLRFSRIGRKEMLISSVNMASTVELCRDELMHEPGRKDYSFETADLPNVQGDAAMLKQVWINLISNAIKYSSTRDFPRIEVGVIPGFDKNTFYIKDNGVGFDMKYADKLFGVFQRLHSSNDFEGTGVGLALVNRIITKHNGKVWAEAAVGKGATFFFTIPVLNTNN